MSMTAVNELLEKSLLRSEARFRAMFEQSAVGMAMADEYGVFVRVNDAFATMVGLDPEALVGKSFLDVTHPDDIARATTLLLAARQIQGPAVTYEKRYVRQDGSVCWARATVNRMFDSDGRHQGYTAVVEDVSAAHAARDELESQMRLQHDILDQMPIMISIWRGRKILYVNREWQRTFGYTMAEARSMDLVGAMTVSGAEAARAYRLMEGERREWTDFEVRARDGTTILCSWLCVLLADGSMMALGQNVRERRKLEAQLAQAQKMEALGHLAAGVAHDFNNLLTVIGGCVSFLKAETEGNAPAARDIEEIRRSTDRAAALTRQLLAFSRQQLLNPEIVNVNEQVTLAVKTFRRLIGEHIELAVVPAARRPMVEVDAHQLDQVLVNLVVNARDAIGEHGTITVATENVLRVEPDGSRREYLALDVTDDGCGIDPAIRDKIFNPFFTTKETGKGTGLGLATVHGIVSQSGGRMELESEVGKGATFRVLLPSVDACPIPATPARETHASAVRETVLLVEDESALRAAARRMLEGAGYRVLEARHGEDALDVLAQEGAVDILVTDVVMPQMGGRDLATQVRMQFPGTPVLFMTGYTDDELLRRGAMERDARVLRKPFYSTELLSVVADLLHQTV